MSIFEKMWVDPVGSKVIATGLIAFISFIILKCKFKFTKLNRKKLFTVLSTKPIQVANHLCIKVKFKSNNAAAEFQRRDGKLVGCDNLIGWIRQDCPILHNHMNALSFKLKSLFSLRHKKDT